MVSFSCEKCGDVIKKPKVKTHGCGFTHFSCIDCHQVFDNNSVNGHTACITEAEKYQGKLYQPPKGKGKKQNQTQPAKPEAKPAAPQQVQKMDESPKKRKLDEVKATETTPTKQETTPSKKEKKEKKKAKVDAAETNNEATETSSSSAPTTPEPKKGKKEKKKKEKKGKETAEQEVAKEEPTEESKVEEVKEKKPKKEKKKKEKKEEETKEEEMKDVEAEGEENGNGEKKKKKERKSPEERKALKEEKKKLKEQELKQLDINFTHKDVELNYTKPQIILKVNKEFIANAELIKLLRKRQSDKGRSQRSILKAVARNFAAQLESDLFSQLSVAARKVPWIDHNSKRLGLRGPLAVNPPTKKVKERKKKENVEGEEKAPVKEGEEVKANSD